jgi:asparagine synthase (glutamine-hydrolysing)
MCGIGGKVSFDARPTVDVAERMCSSMAHRGPNASGVYQDDDVVLAHRRLSIIDLSEQGHQPMSNADGSVHIVFNGEIYNYRELRERVGHYSFTSETDTEVLLHLYEEEGIDCLEHLRGMFAFGIWDERKGRLFLARDRLGQKPLFLRTEGDTVWFGSTVKAILADEAVPVRPDLEALREFLTYQYVPHPRTGFEGIEQLGPAEYAVVSKDGVTRDRYWSVSHADQFTAGPDRLADRVREELREATRLRMRSDVPVGVFLSGGIDSTVTTALMSEMTDEPVRTFSIGFDEYDEFEFARAVAERYDTEHHERVVTPDAAAVLPELVDHFEMPFGDPSAVPTYYVSQVASEDITVALTGDAGDENFAGYDRYVYDRVTSFVGKTPRMLRQVGEAGLSRASEHVEYMHPLARGKRLVENAALDPVERYAQYICHMSPEEARRVWTGPEPDDPYAALRRAFAASDGPERLDTLMGADIRTYLPDDLLVKADRASMAHSIELRSPFLDHEFAQFAARIPAKHKLHRGDKKWLLKRAFADYIPETIRGRSKQGFAVPVNEWFRGDLRSLAAEKLERLGARDPFDAAGLVGRLDAHASGEEDLGYQLWDLVVLELWYERFVDSHE